MFWFHLVVTAVLLVLLGNFLLNLMCFRKPRSWIPSTDFDPPLVSILVPARNEAERLGPCLDSLLNQDYPAFEILVLDDQSEDQTSARVEERMAPHRRLRLLRGTDRPEGWTGKAWACHQLAAAAYGDYLLFTDADTRHEPMAVRLAVGAMLRSRADLVSLWPRQLTGTWGEMMVIPFVHVLLLFFLPHWMPGRDRSLGAANGQFMLFRRRVYEAIGGHERVKNHLVDDVALAREVRQRGWRVLNADGSDLVSCRMYTSLADTVEGFTKNLRPGFEEREGAFWALMAVQFYVLFLPFVWWPVLVVGQRFGQLDASLTLVSVQVLIILAMRSMLAYQTRQPWLGVVFHPIGQLITLWIGWNSWRASRAGTIVWKGRCYPQRHT